MPWVSADELRTHAIEHVLSEFPDLVESHEWDTSGIADRRAVTALFKDDNGTFHPMMVLIKRKYRPLDTSSILLFKEAIAPLRRRYREAHIMVVTNTSDGGLRIICDERKRGVAGAAQTES